MNVEFPVVKSAVTFISFLFQPIKQTFQSFLALVHNRNCPFRVFAPRNWLLPRSLWTIVFLRLYAEMCEYFRIGFLLLGEIAISVSVSEIEILTFLIFLQGQGLLLEVQKLSISNDNSSEIRFFINCKRKIFPISFPQIDVKSSV